MFLPHLPVTIIALCGTALCFNHQLFLWPLWLCHIYCNCLI